MKKQNLRSLKLQKNTISSFQQIGINGGEDNTPSRRCPDTKARSCQYSAIVSCSDSVAHCAL
jgi:hypothetical protein